MLFHRSTTQVCQRFSCPIASSLSQAIPHSTTYSVFSSTFLSTPRQTLRPMVVSRPGTDRLRAFSLLSCTHDLTWAHQSICQRNALRGRSNISCVPAGMQTRQLKNRLYSDQKNQTSQTAQIVHTSQTSQTSQKIQPLQKASDEVVAPDGLDPAEKDIFTVLKEKLDPVSLVVQDISGGCGSMYAIDITSHKFSGLLQLKQHRLVNQSLGDRIKKWHGVQLTTRIP